MPTLCGIAGFPPHILVLFAGLGVFILGTAALFYLFHKANFRSWKLFIALPATTSVFFILCAVATLFLAILVGEDNHAIGSTYFPVNGDIKLACIYKDFPKSCPQTKQDVLGLDPSFPTLLANKDWDYRYYPDTNQYTLIIRHSQNLGVIFDPLLQKLGSLDLAEMQYSCTGQIQAYGVTRTVWQRYKTIRQVIFPQLKSSYSTD